MKISTTSAVLVVAGLTFRLPDAETETHAHAATADEQQSPDGRDGQRDFDFNLGKWKTHVSRLQHPFSGSGTWLEYEGVSIVREIRGGRASVLELDVEGPAGRIRGVGVRLFNPVTRQWNLNWANGDDGVMTKPVVGEFKDGRGEFFNQEIYNGRAIFVRNVFSDITAQSSRFEQAFSDDGGKTWETNWIMTFRRLKDAAAAPEISRSGLTRGSTIGGNSMAARGGTRSPTANLPIRQWGAS